MMDTNDCYLPHSMVAIDNKLCFLDQQNELSSAHPLLKVHVHTADSKEAKVVDKAGRLPAAKLTLGKGLHRKVFFINFELMQQALEKIVTMQGFADRLDQYEHVTNLRQGINCTRGLVRHRLTGT